LNFSFDQAESLLFKVSRFLGAAFSNNYDPISPFFDSFDPSLSFDFVNQSEPGPDQGA
jgi:hypothetical protein